MAARGHWERTTSTSVRGIAFALVVLAVLIFLASVLLGDMTMAPAAAAGLVIVAFGLALAVLLATLVASRQGASHAADDPETLKPAAYFVLAVLAIGALLLLVPGLSPGGNATASPSGSPAIATTTPPATPTTTPAATATTTPAATPRRTPIPTPTATPGG